MLGSPPNKLWLTLTANLIVLLVVGHTRLTNGEAVTVNVGETSILKCPFNESQVNDVSVTWVRKRDGHVLTNGLIKYINDTRISPHFLNNQWILQIRNVSTDEAGVYECALTSNKNDQVANRKAPIRLHVYDSKLYNKDEFDSLMHMLDINDANESQKIKEILLKAENAIKKAEKETGVVNPAVIVNEFLPDPMHVKDMNISEDGALTSFEGSLKNLTIHGLKQLKIEKLLFNLGQIQLKVVMQLPLLSLQGNYDINGEVTWVSFYGDGPFYMNVTGIEVTAYGSLQKTSDGKIQIGDIDLDVETENIDLQMEGLMGGGLMGGITSSLVNQVSGVMFNAIKTIVLDEASDDIKMMINKQMEHLPLDFVDEKSSTIFDGVLERAKEELNRTGLDPMRLPAFKDKFDSTFLIFRVKGEVKIFNGFLSGLTSLVRTGDIVASYHNNEVLFEASMGFNNLTGGYNWTTTMMGGGPKGSASLNIAGISCYLKMKQSLKKGAKPVIDTFRIDKINHLWIDVNGLGSWDFILEIVMNLMTNAFKLSLANAISGPVTEAIQKELNTLPITFL